MEIITGTARRNMRGEITAKTLFIGVDPVKGETDVEIFTAKGNRGTVRSWFQYGTNKNENGFQSFSFLMFQSHTGRLCEVSARATEKTINEQHLKAVELFAETLKQVSIVNEFGGHENE